jgi:hypothetical protein
MTGGRRVEEKREQSDLLTRNPHRGSDSQIRELRLQDPQRGEISGCATDEAAEGVEACSLPVGL